MGFDKLYFQKLLKDAGLKVTPQRIAILEVIYHLKNHPTAEQIHQHLQKENPNIAIGTLYKTLELFAKQNILHRVKTEKGSMLYDAVLEKHHHLYSSESEKIDDYYDSELDEILEKYFAEKNIDGFSIEEIRLQLIGKFSDK